MSVEYEILEIIFKNICKQNNYCVPCAAEFPELPLELENGVCPYCMPKKKKAKSTLPEYKNFLEFAKIIEEDSVQQALTIFRHSTWTSEDPNFWKYEIEAYDNFETTQHKMYVAWINQMRARMIYMYGYDPYTIYY